MARFAFVTLCIVVLGIGLSLPGLNGSSLSENQKNLSNFIYEPVPAPSYYSKSIVLLDFQPGLCTGSFLTPTKILTAAHCYAQSQPRLKVDGKPFPDARFYRNPRYNGDQYDVAVIHLGKHFPGAVTVELLYEEPRCGAVVTHVGYGGTKNGPKSSSPRLNWMKATVVECNSDETEFLTKNQEGSSICKGDSGSPVFNEQNRVVGVVSAFTGSPNEFCKPNRRNFVEKTTYNKDFIVQHL